MSSAICLDQSKILQSGRVKSRFMARILGVMLLKGNAIHFLFSTLVNVAVRDKTELC